MAETSPAGRRTPGSGGLSRGRARLLVVTGAAVGALLAFLVMGWF
ncbi:MAG: hypothetical protein QM695_00635 [Micropruina sp.]